MGVRVRVKVKSDRAGVGVEVGLSVVDRCLCLSRGKAVV